MAWLGRDRVSRHCIETDMSHWPVVVHRTIGSPPDDDVDAFIGRADALLLRGELHAVVFDNTEGGMPSSYMRRKNMEWLDARQGALARTCVATAFVFPSAGMRFVMSTALLVWSQPVEHDVFADVDTALAWARTKLATAKTG